MSEAATTALLPKYRKLTGGWRVVSVAFPVMALILALHFIFHWRPFNFVVMDISYRYLLLAAFLPLGFLWTPLRKKASHERVPWYDIVFAALSLVIPLYFVSKTLEILSMGWEAGAPTVPVILGAILWVLVIEAGRRAAGPVFATVILFFSVYPLFGSHMPGFLWAKDFSFVQVASFHAMSEESILGIPSIMFGRIIIGFMVFAVVLQALGAGTFFNDLAMALVAKTRAGNAKVAIVASGFFGSISGAPIANVMTTGVFTIPAMKKEGLPGYFAGAVEATASSGGALMPPVMGVAAFVMAEFLGVPYSEVVIVAVVPSVLYYVCLFAQIDSYAARIGLKPTSVTVEIPPVWQTLAKNFHIILSFVLLLLILFLLRRDSQAPWIAAALAIVAGLFRKETRIDLQRLISLFEAVGRTLGELISMLAPVGMIIGSFILTGVAFSLPHQIVSLAGGNTVFMLLLGAMAAFILGMGVPIVAVYIFLAIVLAPGLVNAGFDPLAVHLFILYTGVMSYITPPVATAAFAAATIAGSDPMKTGFQAMKLGVAKYILPFVFIASPALILRGSATDMLLVIPTATAALIIISGAMEGYFWQLGKLTIVTRILFFSAGMLMAVPTLGTDLYGIGAFLVLFVLAYILRTRKNVLARMMLVPASH